MYFEGNDMMHACALYDGMDLGLSKALWDFNTGITT